MKLFSKILEEMYANINEQKEPRALVIHAITYEYKARPRRGVVETRHKHVDSGEGTYGDWYNKARNFSRDNPEHIVYLRSFSKMTDSSGRQSLSGEKGQHFRYGKEFHPSSVHDFNEETLDELYDDRKGGGGSQKPPYHKITAISKSGEIKVTEGTGDDHHWLSKAKSFSIQGSGHVIKISHYDHVHLERGGSGYQFRHSRYFQQGKEVNLSQTFMEE